ncbi:MAG: diguanylate cyclase [Pseudoxanthomonas sp.]
MKIPARSYGFPAAILVLLALGCLVVAASIEFRDSNRWVVHTQKVMATLGEIERSQERVSSQVRGYLLTGAPQNLQAFHEAQRDLRRSSGELAVLVADNAAQKSQAIRLSGLLETRLRYPQQAVDTFVKPGPSVIGKVHTGNVDAIQLQIDSSVARMREVESGLLRARQEAAEKSAFLLAAGALLGIPLSLAIFGFAFARLRRENAERTTAEAAAIKANAQLVQTIGVHRKLSENLALLGKFGGMLHRAENVDELMRVTAQALRTLLPEFAGTLYLLKASRDHATVAASWGTPAVATTPTPLLSDCWGMRGNRLFLVDDVAHGVICDHVAAPAEGVVATVCVPLSGHGDTFGWLHLSGPGPTRAVDAGLAASAAEQLALALANVRLRDTLQMQAIRDPLTSLYNRRYLEESLGREISRCRRRSLPLSVLMLDLDHFKAANDEYGHAGGDKLLVAFAGLLAAMCRSEDIACRFGGEEFALVLPEVSAETALKKANEICVATSRLALSYNGRNLPMLTVSIGVASLAGGGETGEGLLRAADRALYLAKDAGRNRALPAIA